MPYSKQEEEETQEAVVVSPGSVMVGATCALVAAEMAKEAEGKAAEQIELTVAVVTFSVLEEGAMAREEGVRAREAAISTEEEATAEIV